MFLQCGGWYQKFARIVRTWLTYSWRSLYVNSINCNRLVICFFDIYRILNDDPVKTMVVKYPAWRTLKCMTDNCWSNLYFCVSIDRSIGSTRPLSVDHSVTDRHVDADQLIDWLPLPDRTFNTHKKSQLIVMLVNVGHHSTKIMTRSSVKIQ